MTNLIVFILLGGLLAMFFAHLQYKTLQKKALYKLYAVRDDLICLVVEGKVSEYGPLFQYYYKRINLLLALAPNVGFDDAIDAFLDLRNDKDFECSLDEAVRRADEMLELVGSEPEEVGLVIANFYSASKYIMLAHSNLLKLLYILCLKKPFAIRSRKLVTKGTYEKLSAVRFAEKEAGRFRDVCHQHAT